MAKISPLGNLLKSFTKQKEEEKLTNIYDDGSVWTLPEEESVVEQYSSPISNLLPSSTVTPGALEAFNNYKVADSELDPLSASRNQMNYYTRQLNELGQEVEKPSVWDKAKGLGLDLLVRAGAVSGSLPNVIAGGTSEQMKQMEEVDAKQKDFDLDGKLEELGFKTDYSETYGLSAVPKISTRFKTDSAELKDRFEKARNIIEEYKDFQRDGKSEKEYSKEMAKDSLKIFKAGADSGLATASGLVTGEYSDKAIDYGRVIEQGRNSSVEGFNDASKVVEAPGFTVAKLLGAEDEVAHNVGNLVADLGVSILTSGLTDLEDVGKSIKYMRNSDKLNDISKVSKFDDALNLAKKYNTYDDYVSSLGEKASKYSDDVLKSMYDKSVTTYANDLIKDVNKGLGGLNNFEGLKLGNNVILSPEKLSQISTNKVQSGLLQVGLGLYSPMGALMSNPIVDTLSDGISKTETGTSIKKDIDKLFKGGKNNEWINAMKDNPENALKYANERKQMDLVKKMSNERIQDTMETINKYSNMKETPEEITKIIEEPVTRRTREIAVEREINNPEYVSKMMNLGKEEYDKQLTSLETMKAKLVQQKEELSKASKDAVSNSNVIEGIDSEISNLQKRIDKVGTIEKAKSIDFNKQMKQFGYNDDYTEMFDKALKTDIETLTKEVGDRDLAEAMQESANRVLDTLDEEFEGISDYFTTYSKIDKNKILTGEASDYFGSPEEIREFSGLNPEQALERAKQKLEESLDEDKVNGVSTELSSKKIKYSTELVKKYQGDYIRDKLDKLGIKIKEGDEYDKMINSLGMTPGEDFIKMLKSKEEYITKSEAKAFKNKAIREHLGTEAKSLEQDLIDLAKKRINEGGDTYTLKHTKNFKDINASKKQTKIKSLEDFRVYKGKSTNIKNSLDDNKAKAMAKQILYEEGEIQKYRIYDKTIDSTLKDTVKLMKEKLPDDVTSYVMKKDAREIAKKFVEESGLGIDYKEVTNRIDRLSYKEIKEELVKITYEKKEELLEQYSKYVKALSDDEIELLKAQQSARRLQPQDVFGEFEMVDGQLVKANNKEVRSASFDKYKTETKKMAEAYTEGEAISKDANVVMNENEGKNLTTTGKDRDKWVDDEEFERKNKGKETYEGSEEFVEGQKKNKALEKSDKYIEQQAKKKKELYDMLVNKYGKEKGEMFFNKTIKDQEVKAKRLLQEKLDELERKKKLGIKDVPVEENKILKEVAVSSDEGIDKIVDPAKTSQEAIEKVEEEASKIVPIDASTPLGKAVNQSLPDSIKDMVGIKLNTANGEIVIDKDMTITELRKLLKSNEYNVADKGSKIIYTNTPIKSNGAIGTYVKDSDTIMINVKSLNKTQMRTVLEHEIGHRTLTRLVKQFPNVTDERVAMDLLEYIPKLDDKSKDKFISIMEKANKGNSATKEMLDIGIVSKYMNDASLNNVSTKTMTQEGYAELFSLYNNKNTKIAKDMKNLNKDAYNKYLEHISSLSDEEVVNVSKTIRKRFGDDYANKILELQNKKNSLTDLDKVVGMSDEVKETQEIVSKLEKSLKDLEESMDSHEFDEAGNVISTDYETFFNKMKETNPEAVKEIEEKSSRYKKLFDMEDELFEIDNTKNLSNEAIEFIDEYKKTMKEIAIREGIYSEEQAEAFTTYVAHMINPKYKDEADIIEKGKILYEEFKDPLNVYSLNRKKQGTLEKLNTESYNQTGRKIYEENINRILLERIRYSEKNILAKNQTNRVLEEFSIPIIRDFEKHINSSEHFMEFFGDELSEKLGLSKKELEAVFKESGSTTKDFLKENLFEEFSSKLPDFKTMSSKDFSEFLSSNSVGNFYKGKASRAFKEGKYDELADIVFESNYEMSNKMTFARSLMDKYGYGDFTRNPLDNIPKFTDDGRPYVYEAKRDNLGNMIESTVDRTKAMPYDIDGVERQISDPIKAYNEYVYKTSKEQNKIIVELPGDNTEKVVKRTISNKNFEKALQDRTELSEWLSEVITGDKEAIDGFDALAGYNVLDPKKITLEEFTVDNGKKKVLIDRNAWENYQKAIKNEQYKEKKALLSIYDNLNGLFKSQAIFTVGFHERNGIQNAVASYIKSGINLFNPKKVKESIQIMMYNKGKLKDFTKEYGGYNIDEILLEAKKGGIFETQLKNEFAKDTTKKFLKGEVDKLEVKKIPLKKSLNPFSTDFVGYRKSQELGGAIEEQAKIINIITHLENGMDLSDAIHMTKETLFDYSDLTEFETKVMKRAIPFYTFMRKNIPSQIDNFANHTARAARMENVFIKASMKNETDKERGLRPDYLDGQLAIGGGKYLNIGRGSDDLRKLVNPLEMASVLNPMIKTPLELMFNKQMYSGSDISKYDKPSEKLKYSIESNVPITRNVTALHKLLTGTEEEKNKAENTLWKTFGSLKNEYDVEKQEKSTMYKYVTQLQNQYYEYIEKHPEAKEELEAKKNKTTTTGYTSPLGKLIKKR